MTRSRALLARAAFGLCRTLATGGLSNAAAIHCYRNINSLLLQIEFNRLPNHVAKYYRFSGLLVHIARDFFKDFFDFRRYYNVYPVVTICHKLTPCNIRCWLYNNNQYPVLDSVSTSDTGCQQDKSETPQKRGGSRAIGGQPIVKIETVLQFPFYRNYSDVSSQRLLTLLEGWKL